ncbi:MAG: 4'-phosphopantetheinyl transferase family protein [Silanimonas sp.]
MNTDFSVRFFDLDAVTVDASLLSASERERVERKATAALRQRQAASFQSVRLTLAAVVGGDPAALTFNTRDSGKPVLVDHAMHFNVSHSGGVGMLAWGPRELGADVEALIARPTDALAEEILSPTELATWRSLPAPDQQMALTRTWARKEALLKAIGSGLRIPPRTVEVGVEANADPIDVPGRIAWVGTHEGRHWIGWDWFDSVPTGFRAAVCIEASSTKDGDA